MLTDMKIVLESNNKIDFKVLNVNRLL